MAEAIKSVQSRRQEQQKQLAAAQKELRRIEQFIHDVENPMTPEQCLAFYDNLNQDHSNNS